MTGADAIDALIRYLESADGKWPKPDQLDLLRHLNTWVALYEGDADTLQRIRPQYRNRPNHYRVDALPERIADAWAHYLVGEDPRITALQTSDQGLLDALIGDDDGALEGGFVSDLERAASLGVGEGEMWGRIYTDALIADHPLLDWVSRRNVIPYWVGPRLAAAAIVTELPDPGGRKDVCYRHFELQGPGVIRNVLYRGTPSSGDAAGKVGNLVALDAIEATAELVPEWAHGLPFMLLARIPNRLRRDRRIGVSDFRGILDTLLDLNEAAAIGAHNMRLSARQRAVITAAAARADAQRPGYELNPEENPAGQAPPRARFDADEEVFVDDPLDAALGATTKDPFRILSYSFDAEPLIAWRRELVETALSRVGLTGQYVGVGEAAGVGYAISGTALRLRLIPTDKTGRGKARYWDDVLPRLLQRMAAVDALPDSAGGFARPWTDISSPPTVERRPGLPVDELEEATRHATLIGAGAESIQTAVEELHPEWDETRVLEEVDRIRQDKAAAPAASMFGA